MKIFRRAIALAAVGTGLAASLAPSASGSFWVKHAFVPGIGNIGSTLPSDTHVSPPGYIPPAEPISDKDFNRQHKREVRLGRRTRPSPDIGSPKKIKRIKHDVARELFLFKAAQTCEPYPKAGLWVFQYIFLSPGLQPYLDQYETQRQLSQNNQGCIPVRMKLGKWQGVHVDRTNGSRARVMANGTYQWDNNGDGRWESSKVSWKVAVRLKKRWRITVYTEFFPGQDSG